MLIVDTVICYHHLMLACAGHCRLIYYWVLFIAAGLCWLLALELFGIDRPECLLLFVLKWLLFPYYYTIYYIYHIIVVHTVKILSRLSGLLEPTAPQVYRNTKASLYFNRACAAAQKVSTQEGSLLDQNPSSDWGVLYWGPLEWAYFLLGITANSEKSKGQNCGAAGIWDEQLFTGSRRPWGKQNLGICWSHFHWGNGSWMHRQVVRQARLVMEGTMQKRWNS